MTYPLHLDLTGRRVLVVGAGHVAERRINGLLDAHADVVVVAPHATPRITTWSDAGLVTWRQRAFDLSDVLGAWLVHAATDDPAVNARVAEDAARRRVWSVRADDATLTHARTPSVVRDGEVVISVTTGDPRRTQSVRDHIALGLADGSLDRRPGRARSTGSVVLIGGGPGSPDLITVRGRRELLTADVVVHDRLAPLDLLALLDPDVEVIDASKAPGAHELSQDDINAVLVDRARRGLRVARLKGGDPFVLGRGGEEVLACVEAGVPVEVVPGVSSALAAPSAAGIPVTHRTVSPGFVVITGHDLDEVDALAGTNLTVVILMGVGRLAAIAARLQAQGRSATTPVAIVERATSPDQRVTVATLSTISSVAREAGVQNPAVIVVGEVVGIPALADALAPDANPSPADANAPAPAGRGLTPDAVAAEV